MERRELEDHLSWLRYEFKNTHPSDRVSRGQLLIAMNCAEEQLKQ